VNEVSKTKEFPAWVLSLLVIGLMRVLTLGGYVIINIASRSLQSVNVLPMEATDAIEPLPDINVDPAVLEAVVGTYLEESSYFADYFDAEIDFVFILRELLFTFNSDMTLEITFESGLGALHTKGDFTVEEITIVDLSGEERLLMKGLQERDDADLYRIAVQSYESGFRTRFDIFMSRRDDSDIAIYIPHFRESIFARQVD